MESAKEDPEEYVDTDGSSVAEGKATAEANTSAPKRGKARGRGRQRFTDGDSGDEGEAKAPAEAGVKWTKDKFLEMHPDQGAPVEEEKGSKVPRDARYFLHDDRAEQDDGAAASAEGKARGKGRQRWNDPVDGGGEEEKELKGPDAPGKWKHDKFLELYPDYSTAEASRPPRGKVRPPAQQPSDDRPPMRQSKGRGRGKSTWDAEDQYWGGEYDEWYQGGDWWAGWAQEANHQSWTVAAENWSRWNAGSGRGAGRGGYTNSNARRSNDIANGASTSGGDGGKATRPARYSEMDF